MDNFGEKTKTFTYIDNIHDNEKRSIAPERTYTRTEAYMVPT